MFVSGPPFPRPALSTLRWCGVWWVVLNLPFLLAHPAWTPPGMPLLRSLGVNAVLFLAPGLAVLLPRRAPQWPLPLLLIAAMFVSFGMFLLCLTSFQLVGWSALESPLLWNSLWGISNAAAALRFGLVATGRVVPAPLGPHRAWTAPLGVFVASYALYYVGATSVVPAQKDHDLEVQATGFALLERLEPYLLSDRGTIYYFAHPPLLHFYAAASFLYFGEAERLRIFDEITQRAHAARDGRAFEPDKRPLGRMQILAATDTHYVVRTGREPASVLPIERVEMERIFREYDRAPHKLETRAPSVFLSALTVALLCGWCVLLCGHTALGVLVAATYATSPEIFVRSSYGGYFAISNFAVLLILMASTGWERARTASHAAACALAGAFAALANHKLAVLPLALQLSSLLLAWPALHGPLRRLGVNARSAIHPALVGFVAGTALFWLYGWSVNAEAFWNEHVRTHIFDRIAHINPLGYDFYPTAGALWGELMQHTGYVLLPLGSFALLQLLASSRRAGQSGGATAPSTPSATWAAWTTWLVLAGLAFTLVDWRMTKHLMPLLIPLHLAPALWAARGRNFQLIVGAVFLLLIGWSLYTIAGLSRDFAGFQISPAW